MDKPGLRATIDWIYQEFEGLCLNVRIKPNISLPDGDIPDNLKIVIFRILQEALNNAKKQGKAETIGVSLKRSDGKIQLVVADDGQGFAIQRLHSRVGYKGNRIVQHVRTGRDGWWRVDD